VSRHRWYDDPRDERYWAFKAMVIRVERRYWPLQLVTIILCLVPIILAAI
jgi:hypothetical protein